MLPLKIEERVRRLIYAYGIHESLPVPIESVAQQFGFTVEYRPNIAPLYGMVYMESGDRRIIINAYLTDEWKRATVAHELGHWIAGHLCEGKPICSDLDIDGPEEEQACFVASLLLIPRRVLCRNATRLSIARKCAVPGEVVRHRLLII